MNICKPLFTIIVAGALSCLAPQAIADNNHGQSQARKHGHDECNAKITSSTIAITIGENGEKKLAWYVSGDCLDNITNVSLANDDGAGFEDLPFQMVSSNSPDAKTSLSIPLVPRTAGIGGLQIGTHLLSAGQYLLQVKSCRNGEAGEKCKISDETYISAVGDQDAIDALIENGPSIAALLKNAPSILAALDNIPSISATLELIKHKLGL